MGSDDTADKGKGKGASAAQEAEHGGGVWQDLARMEAELQDPEEEATQLYSREDLAKMVSAEGQKALAAALDSSLGSRGKADEPPASATLPIDDGDEDETLHHDPEDDDETRHFLEGPESATLIEEEQAEPTQARPVRQPAAAPAKPQDLASTVAIDSDDFADLSFDEVAVAATDLAATVALDAPPLPEEPAEPKVAVAAEPKVAVAKVVLAKVPASQAKPAQQATPSPVRLKPSDDEPTELSRAPRHKPSDYLKSATLSTPPPRRRRGGDTWSIVLVVALVALAASLVLLWMRLA